MKNDLSRFAKGFVYAGQGICRAIREERNFRFHLCALYYVCHAALMAQFDGLRWAVLFLCFGLILSLELVNSAVERAVDKPDTAHWPSAGAAKDMAAGAVLAAAVCVTAVAVCLFGEPQTLHRIWNAACRHPVITAVLALQLPLWYYFIFCCYRTKDVKGEKTNAEK